MEAKKTKGNGGGIRRTNMRKDTLIEKAYELGGFDVIGVPLIICKHGQYTTYKSRNHAS
jgi:hypothetical protein